MEANPITRMRSTTIVFRSPAGHRSSARRIQRRDGLPRGGANEQLPGNCGDCSPSCSGFTTVARSHLLHRCCSCRLGKSCRPCSRRLQVLARRRQRAFATSASDHSLCAIGVYTHNLQTSPAQQADLMDALGVFGELDYVTPADLALIPVLGSRPKHVVYSPLAELRFPRT